MGTDAPQETFSKRRWVILAASFCSLLLTGFGQFHSGVMKVALIRHWGCDVSTVTWLVSYYTGSFALTAPVCSVFINLVNCRACVVLSGVLCLLGFVLSSYAPDVLYLFFTLTLVGIGQGMSNSGSLVILGYYFPDKTNIVTGVSVAGGALGIFIHPPLLQAFVDWFGLRGAFLLSGAVAFHSCVCGALMRPAGIEQRATQSKRQGNFVQRVCHVISDACSGQMTLLTSWSVLTILASTFFFSLAIHLLMVQLPAYLISRSGLTPTQAAFSISAAGIGSFFSRLLSGFIAYDPRIGNRLLFCGLSGVHVLVSLAAPPLLTKGVVGSYIYLFMVGLYSGGCFSLVIAVVYDVVSLQHFSTAFGMLQFVVGVGALLGAPLSEQVYYDKSQNPYVLFGFVAALFFTSVMFGSLVTTAPTSKTEPQPPFSEEQHAAPTETAVHDNVEDSEKIPEQEKLLGGTLAVISEDSTVPAREDIQLLTVRSNNSSSSTEHHQEATTLTLDSSPLLERADGVSCEHVSSKE